jgi:signal transduction histidine kinase
MNVKLARLSRRYQAALREYVRHGPRAGLHRRSQVKAVSLPRELGGQALAAGLNTLDLVRIHERALVVLDLVNSRDGILKRSQDFFAKAITPIEETHRAAQEAKVHLDQLNQTLHQRTAELASTNLHLKKEIARRRSIEQSLKKSKQHYGHLLAQAGQLHEQLRRLSRQILSAQEEERKKISRELHDVIAQTLTGINVQLARLKTDAAVDAKSLEKNISSTQLLVEKSVNIVHQFARELRPTVLDDLGLIPALHTFMKGFTKGTGIRVSLTAFASVEHLTSDKRTVLYRVAQEALTNVARHANASRAEVSIQKRDSFIRLKIKDNGNGFQAKRVLHAKKVERLGLLGMRERLEMVGGNFSITSAAGRGTTILAQIPLTNRKPGGSLANHVRYSQTLKGSS